MLETNSYVYSFYSCFLYVLVLYWWLEFPASLDLCLFSTTLNTHFKCIDPIDVLCDSPCSQQLDSIYLFNSDDFFAVDQLFPEYHSHLFETLLSHLSLQILFGILHWWSSQLIYQIPLDVSLEEMWNCGMCYCTNLWQWNCPGWAFWCGGDKYFIRQKCRENIQPPQQKAGPSHVHYLKLLYKIKWLGNSGIECSLFMILSVY